MLAYLLEWLGDHSLNALTVHARLNNNIVFSSSRDKHTLQPIYIEFDTLLYRLMKRYFVNK